LVITSKRGITLLVFRRLSPLGESVCVIDSEDISMPEVCQVVLYCEFG